MLINTTSSLFTLAILLTLGGLGEVAWAQEADPQPATQPQQGDQQNALPPLESNLLEEGAQPNRAAQGDSQETRMMYFTRNLSAQVLVNFLRGRNEFAAVRATPNHDTESVVLSGPEDKVREAVILIRRVDLVGRAVTDPASVPQTPPMAEVPEATREANPRFKTVTYAAQSETAATLADKVRDRAADGVLPGILAFVNQQSNSVILTGAEPELGMALDFLKRVDTVRGNTGQVNAIQEPEQDPRPNDEPPAEVRPPLQAQRQTPRGQVDPSQRGAAFRQPAQPAQPQPPMEPEGHLHAIQLELLLLALPADQTKRQSESIDQLSGPIEQVMAKIDELTAEEEAKILNQFSLSTIAGETVTVQVGQRTPRITGAQSLPRRDPGGARPVVTNLQTQVENVGTMARLQAKIDSDQKLLLLNLQFEKSFAAQPESGVTIGTDDEGDDIKVVGNITMTLSQTVLVESGHAAALVISTSIDGEKSQSVRYVLVVGGTL